MGFPFIGERRCALVALAGLLVLFLAGVALAGSTTYHNAKGQVVAHKDASGRITDAKGQLRAREDEQGRIYDAKGRHHGRRDRDTAPKAHQRRSVTAQ